MDYSVFERSNIEELKSLLWKGNQLQIVSYKDLESFSQNEISQFCVDYGFYSIPTLELISFLKEEIGEENLNRTIEIGAGHGAISRELKIKAFDNFMQLRPEVKAMYENLGQAIVPYGNHVENMDGNEAIKKIKPKIAIGAYCTHKYNPKEYWRKGNAYGINEGLILERTQKYIHIGNRTVHGMKPILKYKHREIKENWIIGRSQMPNENVIWIWEGKY